MNTKQGATNADRGATNVDGGAMNADGGAMNVMGCNKCRLSVQQMPQLQGATNAKTKCNKYQIGCNKCRNVQLTLCGCNGHGATDATNVIAQQMQLWEQQIMLKWGCMNCASWCSVLVTQIRSGRGKECYWELITCCKLSRAARNRPNKCIRMSE
jgi:hypothetical protein